MRHATDPDHVIAVSTIVSRERSIAKAGLIGILWGCGHTLTIVAVGAAIILFGLAIPVRVGLTMEFSVGLMLILLGVLNLTGAMKWISERFSPAHPRATGEHAHLHEHGSHVHFHWHSHAPAADHHGNSLAAPNLLRGPFGRLGLFHALRPLFVGIVHGLAGSAALALPFTFAGYKFAWLNRGFVIGSGLLSLSFGLFVCYQIGFVGGLFTHHPHWTPSCSSSGA